MKAALGMNDYFSYLLRTKAPQGHLVALTNTGTKGHYIQKFLHALTISKGLNHMIYE